MGRKRGRKRQSGARYPSGDLKPVIRLHDGRPSTKPTFEPLTGVQWQRLVWLVRHGKADPRLECQVSRLCFLAELSVAQAAAGHRIAEIYGAYEALTRAPHRSARSPSYGASFGSGEGEVAEELLSPQALKAREEKVEKACKVWNELQTELRMLRRDLANAIEDLCVNDYQVSPIYYEEIRIFLDRCAHAWNMGGGKNVKKGKSTTTLIRVATPATARTAATSGHPATRPRENSDRTIFIKTVMHLNPDIDFQEAANAYDDYFAPLKERDRFERQKRARRAPPPRPGPTVQLARPKLALPEATP